MKIIIALNLLFVDEIFLMHILNSKLISKILEFLRIKFMNFYIVRIFESFKFINNNKINNV